MIRARYFLPFLLTAHVVFAADPAGMNALGQQLTERPIVRAEVTTIAEDPNDPGIKVVTYLIHEVYGGEPKLKATRFVAYATNSRPHNGELIDIPNLKEESVWRLMKFEGEETFTGVVQNADLAFPFENRTERKRLEQGIRLGKAVQAVYTAKPDKRLDLLTQFATDATSEVSEWSIRQIVAFAPEEWVTIRKHLIDQPATPVATLAIVLDADDELNGVEKWLPEDQATAAAVRVGKRLADPDTCSDVLRRFHRGVQSNHAGRRHAFYAGIAEMIRNPAVVKADPNLLGQVLNRCGKRADQPGIDLLLQAVTSDLPDEVRVSAAYGLADSQYAKHGRQKQVEALKSSDLPAKVREALAKPVDQ